MSRQVVSRPLDSSSVVVALALGVVFSLQSFVAAAEAPTLGWTSGLPDAFDGYTLFAPNSTQSVYLVDNYGRVVHQWQSDYRPGNAVYLLENGNLLRAGRVPGTPRITAGGVGGIFQVLSWESEVLWEYTYSTDLVQHHHDVEMLPNGNVLVLAWEAKTEEEAIAAGRDPSLLSENELWPEQIIEVEQRGQEGGVIVWRWSLWDHLVQDFDETKANYGVVGDHPERLDINAARDGRADWIHANSIDYNAALDQIVISANAIGEFWVIDHSTTSAEAAGTTGGRYGRGGDFLYRWGNPANYDAGNDDDRKLFQQHCVEWIPDGYPGAGNLMIFNNGNNRPAGAFSTVEELVPPIDGDGVYAHTPGEPFGPEGPTWSFGSLGGFYTRFLGGARRLPNGNTIVCDGPNGYLFEVTPAGMVVWEYHLPFASGEPLAQGEGAGRTGCFRTQRYAPDYPGLEGRDLARGEPIELYTLFDGNFDGSLDADDLACFYSQFTGACDDAECSAPLYPNAAGFAMDGDRDGDVDCADWELLRAAWSETPGRAPLAGLSLCADFVRGDADDNQNVDVADSVRALEFLFLQSGVSCIAALDVNDDEQVDVRDPVYLLFALFADGPSIPAPSSCGRDPTPALVPCVATSCP